MEFGVHLPTMAFGEHSFSLADLVSSAEAAERLGFTTLCANDHLIYSRPWLDGLIALASILTCTQRISLMTTAALPVVRGPAALAKALAAYWTKSRQTINGPYFSAQGAREILPGQCSASR